MDPWQTIHDHGFTWNGPALMREDRGEGVHVVPFALVDRRRLRRSDPPRQNAMCQKDGCTCWCQACERHNWRHAKAGA